MISTYHEIKTHRASEALSTINCTVFLSTSLNSGHIHGHGKNTLILPVRARDGEKQPTSQESMFNFVRLSSGGASSPVNELPSETEILIKAGTALFGNHPVPWSELSSNQKIRETIACAVPDMDQMANLYTGNEFTIPNRIKHSPHFNTRNGKANLAVIKEVDTNPKPGYFNLMTFRSEGQFNTIIYEVQDLYRGTDHRNVVFLNSEDIATHQFTKNQKVWVESEIGRMGVEVIEGPIKKGNAALYFPEANAIVPGNIDPQSKTPSFKRISVKIYPV